VASLNQAILKTTAAGGNANALMDQRDTALGTLASMTGATTRQNADGTVDVVLGGNALVAGTQSRSLQLAGTTDIAGADSNPVQIQWADTGASASIDGGSVAAQLSTLAGASSGTGGVYAETADAYNAVATQLAAQVNAVHETGTTSTGATGVDFFSLTAGQPAALGLGVIPTSVSGIAASNAANGGSDGSVADAIAQLGTTSTAPDAGWSSFVSTIGTQSKNATTQSSIADSAATSAQSAQTSQSGVDLDEETTNLVTYQHAYEAAARVMTTLDSILDTLINHTGITT